MSTQVRNSRSSDGSGRAAFLAAPHVSVVVASNRSRASLTDYLETLHAECSRLRAELIVARDGDDEELEVLTAAYSELRLLAVRGGPSVPELRAAGMREATGDIVVLADDHTPLADHWLDEICAGVDVAPDRTSTTLGETPNLTIPSSSIRRRPYLSVVIPVRNGKPFLAQMLETLCRSELPRSEWELIVVDDGSSDDSAVIASRYADVVIRLTGRSRGPGYARNRGVERARGECVVFLDSDVVVRPDTLREVAHTMATRDDIDALFGAYCDEPPAAGTVSQYRNLFHHYTHDQEPGEVQSFWAGCGCVRRAVFVGVGMYDEWRFSRAQIEDIELGYRLVGHGHRILLRPEIQVTHLKAWTFWGMLKADFMDRGVPWARLLAEQSALLGPETAKTRSLKLRSKERSNSFFVSAGVLLLAAGPLAHRRPLVYAGLALLALVVVRGLPLYAFFMRKRGLTFALASIVLHLIYYATAAVSVAWGAFLALVIGEPRPDPAVEAFSELNFAVWPPVPKSPSKRMQKPVALNV